MTRAGAAFVAAGLLLPLNARAEAPPLLETGAASQAPQLRVMSLSEAIQYARTHQPAIRAASARMQAQAALAEVPRAEWYPKVGATAQLFAATANNTTGTYVSAAGIDVPRIGATRATGTGSFEPSASTLVGVGLRQELFDFGRIAAQSAAQDALTDVARQRLRSADLDVRFDVEEAYFAVFAARSVMTASQDAYDRSQVHRDLAKAGVGSGLRSPIELTRAQAELANFDIGRIRAAAGLAAAQTVFAASVGVADEALDVSEVPPAPAELPDLTRAIELAEARDPQLAEAIARWRADEQVERAIRAELRPNLSLTGTLSGRAGGAQPSGTGTLPDGSGFLPRVPNWDVGVVLGWPLFDRTVSKRADAAAARARASVEDINLVRERQRAFVREAFAEVKMARAVLPGLERAQAAARDNYAQADARFKAGLGTSVELADAEGLRAAAEIQLALGQFALARTRATFGRSIAEGL